MNTLVISLPNEYPKKHAQCVEYFKSQGLEPIYLNGFHGEQFGLKCEHPYNRDRSKWEEGNFFIGHKYTGVFLSHYLAWSCALMLDEHTMICEDDVRFEDDWRDKLEQALKDVPPDYDFLFIGSCCVKDKSPVKIKGDVYEARYPQCLHCYIVAKKAIPFLLSSNRDCYAPIDVSLILNSFPFLKVYTLIPRLASQLNTEIPE